MQSNRNQHNFSALLLIITVFSFGLIFLRFSQIMVHGEIDGRDLEENIERLYTKNHTIQANRGTIYDRYGNPIAIDATSYKMIGVLTDKWSTENSPQHVTDVDAVADVIAEHINLSAKEVKDFLNLNVDQIEFGSSGNDLSYHTALNIKADLEEKDLTGIIFEEKQKRLYPNGTFASHSVGLALYPEDETEADVEEKQLVGEMGLEQSFNDLLTGQNGMRTYKKDSFGYLIPSLAYEEIDPVNGDDLYLTLDHKLQAHLETILDQVNKEHEPKNMTVTVMNPKNGEILASGQRPSFNATTLENIDASWQNLLVEYAFEPGSTIKILTMAAAIEEGVFHPNKYFKSGTIEAYGATISDHVPAGWGWISYLEGLARSSNLLFVELVDEMGHDVWKEYLDAYGFGKNTGMLLPNETPGYNSYEWELDKVSTGFGQGMSVTPVQMLQALSAIANEGEMVRPKLAAKTADYQTNEETIIESEVKQSKISKESAELALDYLKQSTEMEQSIARGFLKDGYSISAKTGTAQIYDAELGKYSGSRYVYSVAAMLPAEDPQYLLYITVQEPTPTEDAPTGSQVVQKVYHQVLNRIIDFNEDVTEGEQETSHIQYVSAPSFLDMSSTEAADELVAMGYDYSVIGTGEEIVQQLPYPDTPLFDEQQIILMTNGAATIPDLTDWSRNDVLKIAELTGSNFVFEGEGYVVGQSLAEGAYMEPGLEITVILSPNASGDIPAATPVNEEE